jgi:cell division cycle 20-like protein 1 (cofactor of APC complex)
MEMNQKLSSFKNCNRKINKLPIKVLDAPALQDDFYLNLLDWSPENYLAVGLATSVYLWNAGNSKVTKLCDLGVQNSATSVACSTKSPRLSLGTDSGEVQIWDIEKLKQITTLTGHSLRVGAMSWSTNLLSTGSRDKTILQRDLRVSSQFVAKLSGHKQEICGLKWSFDEQQLCSGGNDNKLLIWDNHFTDPIVKFTDHVAAVKAMAWSPHQHGLLVSGGGTADRTIKVRNTLTGTTIESYDVGSQVCNLMFSKTLNELVSTHGYSHNEINIWRYPEMQKLSTLTGHTYRVLYLAMSPDGSTIVTGAGDETLRFWNIFPSKTESSKSNSKILNMESIMLR